MFGRHDGFPKPQKGILSSVSALNSSAITISLVEIVTSIAVRCREMLFEHGSKHLDVHPSIFPEVQGVYEVYRSCLRGMWSWVVDDSKTSEAVAAKCIEKFETIFDLGCSMTSAISSDSFPRSMDYYLMEEVIRWAMEAIGRTTSLVQATKVLQQAPHSWPVKILRGWRIPFRSCFFSIPFEGNWPPTLSQPTTFWRF